MNFSFPLTNLYKACPEPDLKELEQAIIQNIQQAIESPEFTEQDLQFLKALKIGDT